MIDKDKSVIVTTEHKELKLLIENIVVLWRYLLAHWLIIVVFGVGGAILGLSISFIVKPRYTANLSFSLLEKSAGSSGLAGLVSSFGVGSLFGDGGNAFTGDNLLEIIKSRYTIEKTLLSPMVFQGEEMTMADAYIKINRLDEKWSKKKSGSLHKVSFPLEQKRETYSRMQDSILGVFYNDFIESKQLSVIRREKKISMVYVSFTSLNEQFSKYFVENLIEQTSRFYKETRMSQSIVNINMMQQTADSIKALYEEAIYGSAAISSVNINTAYQTAVVPRIKQENNAQLYGTVYAEVLKNLETLKLDMAKETPIIQIIDKPYYPLKIKKIGKLKGLVFGGFAGGVLIVFFLLIKRYFKGIQNA
ncbi:hypothetical protein SDC9_27769 [bioreactor metagenome]|jgi:hypothetical protein|uniref:Polysaccharide chain length determinant N-terminal domain-containing protein n=1 Tax=bioreactor metagenome TaxID=1076179 RepID=A0A644URZ6_9ZZZZ|nr:hypothetical protein [Paludibacter sp.]